MERTEGKVGICEEGGAKVIATKEIIILEIAATGKLGCSLKEFNAKHLVHCWNAFEKGGLVDELVGALEKYGEHLGACYQTLRMGECTCGLTQALAKAKQA